MKPIYLNPNIILQNKTAGRNYKLVRKIADNETDLSCYKPISHRIIEVAMDQSVKFCL